MFASVTVDFMLTLNFFVEDSYNVRFDLPSGHPYSVFLLEDSAFE